MSQWKPERPVVALNSEETNQSYRRERTSLRTPQILGAFVKLRKATISFVISVRQPVSLSGHPSVHMKQLGSQCTDFHDIIYLSIFLKYVEKKRVSLKSDKNDEYFS